MYNIYNQINYGGKNGGRNMKLTFLGACHEVTGSLILLEAAGRRRGFLISGGEVDTERMAKILLDEFRGGKLGRFTLEMPQ